VLFRLEGGEKIFLDQAFAWTPPPEDDVFLQLIND